MSLTAVRLAPVVGPHVPSPLGRLLRLPVVPTSLLADPAFSVIDDQDAATAVVAAAARRFDGPVNVVSPGAVTASQAVRIGGRVALPADRARVAHRPPRHQRASARRSPSTSTSSSTGGARRTAALAAEALGFTPRLSTRAVVQALYEWATVIHLRPSEVAA